MTGRPRCRMQLSRTERRLPHLPMHPMHLPDRVPLAGPEGSRSSESPWARNHGVCEPTPTGRHPVATDELLMLFSPRFVVHLVHRARAGRPGGLGIGHPSASRRSSGSANARGSTVASQHSCQCRACLRHRQTKYPRRASIAGRSRLHISVEVGTSGPAFNFPAAGSEHRTCFRSNHGVGLREPGDLQHMSTHISAEHRLRGKTQTRLRSWDYVIRQDRAMAVATPGPSSDTTGHPRLQLRVQGNGIVTKGNLHLCRRWRCAVSVSRRRKRCH